MGHQVTLGNLEVARQLVDAEGIAIGGGVLLDHLGAAARRRPVGPVEPGVGREDFISDLKATSLEDIGMDSPADRLVLLDRHVVPSSRR